MANYLVANEPPSAEAGHDGIVVDSTGQKFFMATYVAGTPNHLKVYKSEDGGQTWSLVQDITSLVSNAYAMFMDTSDRLHLAYRRSDLVGSGFPYEYKRYDPPSYAVVVEETAGGAADSFSPTGLVVTSAGIVYIFYQMTQNPAPQNYILRYGRRTGVATWVMDTNLLSGATNAGSFDVDYLLSSNGSTIYIVEQLEPVSPNMQFFTLVGTTFTFIFNPVIDANRHNTWLAEVSGTPRVYDSKTDGQANSADIYFTTQAGGRALLFTSPRAGDALRGVSQDNTGVNVFYGNTTGILYRKHHNIDGTLDGEVVEVPELADALWGQRNVFNVAYPRKLGVSIGGAGYYTEPIGTTRFFTSLTALEAATPNFAYFQLAVKVFACLGGAISL